jgi:hypothetical protein
MNLAEQLRPHGIRCTTIVWPRDGFVLISPMFDPKNLYSIELRKKAIRLGMDMISQVRGRA